VQQGCPAPPQGWQPLNPQTVPVGHAGVVAQHGSPAPPQAPQLAPAHLQIWF
jgi:hypothetical protein